MLVDRHPEMVVILAGINERRLLRLVCGAALS
jgi:hypothetical protein